MSDNVFWIIVSVVVGAVVLGFFAMIYFGVTSAKEKSLAYQNSCLEKGGSYIPLTGGDMCLTFKIKVNEANQ